MTFGWGALGQAPFNVVGSEVVVEIPAHQPVGWAGPIANVFDEGFKGVAPAVIHRDAAPTVAWVLAIRGAEAHGFHASPDVVFRCSGVAVGSGSIPATFHLDASTGSSEPLAKVPAVGNHNASALTLTEPAGL